jgi:hypothetical protein
MITKPLGAYQLNLGDVTEQYWSIWLLELCLWILLDHFLMGGMKKIYGV